MAQVSRMIYKPEVSTQAIGKQTLGKQTITLKTNTNHAGLAASVNKFLESAEGLFRFGQLADRAPKFVNAVRAELDMPRLAPLDICTSKSLIAWTWLTTIPRAITMTPGVIADVSDAVGSINDRSLGLQHKRYKLEKATREVTDAVAMYGHSAANVASLFPGLSQFGVGAVTVAETATTIHDGVSLHLNVENLTHALSVDVTKATPEMKKTIEGTIRYNMLATLKDIVAFTSGFFGMLLMTTGTTVLPGIAFVTLSLASTVFAVTRKLYEDSMPFKPINFLDNKQVSLITA